MSLALLVLLAWAAVGLAPADAAAPATQGATARPAETVPSFPSAAQVVVLDVIATRGKDQPVVDLRPEELQVTENGRPGEILSVRLVRAGRPAGDGASPRASDGKSAGSAPSAETTPARASLVVLVFDRLTVEAAPLARKGALSLLDHPFPSDTWFAVFKVRYGVHLLASFTTDRATVRAAVERATGGDTDATARTFEPGLPPVTLPPPGLFAIPDLRAVASGLSGPEAGEAQKIAGLDSFYAIVGIAQALQQVQGRKAIVYFSEAWQLDPLAVRNAWDDLVSAANRANVAVHTVDARGLLVTRPIPLTAADSTLIEMNAESRAPATRGAPPAPKAGGAGSSGTGGDAPGLQAMIAEERLLSGFTLQRLADETGGRAIMDTNDLGAGLVRAAQELRQYHEIVYAPADPVLDGRFRRVRVELSRPGVHLRTRAGYFATPGGAPKLSPYELPLMAALADPDPPDRLPLRADVLHFAAKGGERQCVLLAEVPLREVEMVEDAASASFRAHLSLLGYVKDESGGVVARLTHDWPIEGPLEARDAARVQPAVFGRVMPLPAGRYRLELAVRDRTSGATSVVRTAFEVPLAGPRLSLGSPTVLRRVGAAAPGTSADDPLRVGDSALSPALGAPFVLGSAPALPVYVGVYPARGGGPASLSVELRRDGAAVESWTESLGETDATGRAVWLAGIPADRLKPGRHELLVTAHQGTDAVSETTSLDVLPAPPEVGGDSPTPVGTR